MRRVYAQEGICECGYVGSAHARDFGVRVCAKRVSCLQQQTHRGQLWIHPSSSKLGGAGYTGPQVGVAMTEFDGIGALTQIDTVTVSGQVVADFTHTPATGTYTVNSDCTGTFTINFTDGRPPVVVNFVV